MSRHLANIILIVTLLCGIPVSVSADTVIELPVLAAIRQNNLGVFEILLMWWDKKPEPNPVQLQWFLAGVRIAGPSLCKGWPIDPRAATVQAPARLWPWDSSPCSRGSLFSGVLP